MPCAWATFTDPPGAPSPSFWNRLRPAVRSRSRIPRPPATSFRFDAAVDAILAATDSPVDGCILLPDLGEPRRILDLARSLIGAAPIEIEFIGLRPGEKLREELVSATEVREGRTASGLEIIRTPSPSPAELDEHMARIAQRH